jgi:choline dehydrogenase-like flavoprotein
MEDITQGGPLGITETRFRSEFGAAFVEACAESGMAAFPGESEGTGARAGFYQFTQSNGRRSSTAWDYLEPVASQSNLAIWTRATAHRVRLEGHRAAAVTGTRAGVPFIARARREIVLAAGALGTPQILLLSGLGPAMELSRLGIPVQRDLPGVGRGLQDHPRTTVLFRAARTVSLSAVSLAKGLVQWTLTRRGLLTSPAVAAGAFLQVAEGSQSLDCQLLASWRGTPHDTGLVNIQPVLMEVESRGTVRLSSADPGAPLLVDPAYLSSPRDGQILVQGVRIARALGQAPALRRFGLLEVQPGPAVSSEPDLRRYLARSVETAFHPAGTCRMGIDHDSVVDPELRVHGVEGLRVADASVMPVLINANTNGPTLMIAEKAADVLRGRCLSPEPVLAGLP